MISSLKSGLDRNIQKERQVRVRFLCRQLIQSLNKIHPKSPHHTLVHGRAVPRPIHQDHLAGCKRRKDNLPKNLRPSRLEEENLRRVCHPDILRRKQYLTDLFGNHSPSGLPNHDNILTRFRQSVPQPLDLNGLPRPLSPFKTDENTLFHSLLTFSYLAY